MRDDIDAILGKLLKNFGAEIFKNPNRFRGAILDYPMERNAKKIRFLLTLAMCEMKVYTRLLSVSIESLVEEMHTEYEINRPAAREVVGCIAALHSLKVDREIEIQGKADKIPQREEKQMPTTETKVISIQGTEKKTAPRPQNKVKEADILETAPTRKQPVTRKLVVEDLNYQVGDKFLFGQYKWRILKINDNGTALVITQDIIQKMAYHNRRVNINWEKSDIRQYLNTSFYEKFTSVEQKAIVTTEVDNPFNEKYFTQGGGSTIDKVFLLSIQQAQTLFKNDMDRVARLNLDTEWWWLRSPGRYPDHSAFVYRGGNISMDGEVSIATYMNNSGMRFVNYKVGGIRPAMVIKLDKI